MQISVIIVSYNAKYFLEQCLHSVLKAVRSLNYEIIITDNASSDGTMDLIENRFPTVRFIANSQNLGFSKANNEGLRIASGKYILFLNPDTLLAEDSLLQCVEFFENNNRWSRTLPERIQKRIPEHLAIILQAFRINTVFPAFPAVFRVLSWSFR